MLRPVLLGLSHAVVESSSSDSWENRDSCLSRESFSVLVKGVAEAFAPVRRDRGLQPCSGRCEGTRQPEKLQDCIELASRSPPGDLAGVVAGQVSQPFTYRTAL